MLKNDELKIPEYLLKSAKQSCEHSTITPYDEFDDITCDSDFFDKIFDFFYNIYEKFKNKIKK